MTIPPTFVITFWYCINTRPNELASTPNVINIIEKPSTKKNPFRTIFHFADRLVSLFDNSSLETPEINPRYAGTSGSVQGARNVKIPATNADNINAKLRSIIN